MPCDEPVFIPSNIWKAIEAAPRPRPAKETGSMIDRSVIKVSNKRKRGFEQACDTCGLHVVRYVGRRWPLQPTITVNGEKEKAMRADAVSMCISMQN